jgi:hypothetical protein
MATKKTEVKKSSNAVGVGVGVGVTAALISAAGAYFLYGSKHAEKNRKMVKSWTLRAKAEVLEGIEKAKDMTQEEYEQLIDKTIKVYGKVKNASADELMGFAKEMKSHWKTLEKKGARQAKVGEAAVKKVVKKAAKKVEAGAKAVAKKA